MKGKTIVVDAGHGYQDGGASANNLQEKELTLAIALKLRDNLKAAGATVIMTRSTDKYLTLAQRVSVANNANADLFFSVHANSSTNPAGHGMETYYYDTGNTRALTSEFLHRKYKHKWSTQWDSAIEGLKAKRITLLHTQKCLLFYRK